MEAAKLLDDMDDLPGPLLVDSMSDSAMKWFGSFPDRLYVIHKGLVAYQGGVGPHGYKVSRFYYTSWHQSLVITCLCRLMKLKNGSKATKNLYNWADTKKTVRNFNSI